MCFHKRAAPKAGCLSGKAPALTGFGPLSLINKMINPLEVEEFKVAPRRCPWGRGWGGAGGPAAPQNPGENLEGVGVAPEPSRLCLR